ncbi:MAG: hypothetical protein WCJ64_01405 [Rhodospirillaceae bacterium]
MPIKFIHRPFLSGPVTMPVFGNADNYISFQTELAQIALEVYKSFYIDGPFYEIPAHDWGIVSVTGKSLRSSGLFISEYCCPVPNVTGNIIFPTISADIPLDGWKAGIVLAALSIQDFYTLGDPEAICDLTDFCELIVNSASHACGIEPIQYSVQNARTRFKILKAAAEELGWTEVAQIIH